MVGPTSTHAARALLTLILASVSLPTTGQAQEYRTEKIDAVGIEISISKRLKRLPLKLASSDPHLRARFRAQDARDYVQTKTGPANWYTDVYEFKKASPTTKSGDGGGDVPKGIPKELHEQIRAMRGRGPATSFEEWVKTERVDTFVTKGKQMKKKGKFLPYKHWVYLRNSNGIEWYHSAAVYTVNGREVALVVRQPLTKGKKPRGKFAIFLKRCITSGRIMKRGSTDTSSVSRDKHVDNDEKKTALTAARKNITGLRDWDYFTTPSYIVLYSWLKGGKTKSFNMSKKLSDGLENMRVLYQEYYPPQKDMKMPYSVLRVCATYKQFTKYGETSRGVVGWFSPRSKELVVFQGGDKLMRKKGATRTVTFHEGWHQYSDSYFKGTELHRWFDEGHGDFFGAHKLRGKKWVFVGSNMRYKWVKLMVKKGDFVRFKDITTWPRSRFYGNPKTAYYYAQAFGMISFLRQGQAMGKAFDPKWSEILPMYRRVTLEEEDAKKGVEAAFEGVDLKAMEAAWVKWVKSPRFKKPK
jgi:hypothetical protein